MLGVLTTVRAGSVGGTTPRTFDVWYFHLWGYYYWVTI